MTTFVPHPVTKADFATAIAAVDADLARERATPVVPGDEPGRRAMIGALEGQRARLVARMATAPAIAPTNPDRVISRAESAAYLQLRRAETLEAAAAILEQEGQGEHAAAVRRVAAPMRAEAEGAIAVHEPREPRG